MLIDKNEVLRYLGHTNQPIDDQLSQLIDSCIEEVRETTKPLFVFKLLEVEPKENRVLLKETPFVLEGHDIAVHLKDTGKCALMAATLGADIDKRIKYLEINQMTRALIVDACATAAIEGVCDAAENEIRELVSDDGFDINYRFSPGYGDLPLSTQPDILTFLNAQKRIGLTCTENYIMLPRKSVTAIIGLIKKQGEIRGEAQGETQGEAKGETRGAEIQTNRKSCSDCQKYSDCLYRRRVGTCSEH